MTTLEIIQAIILGIGTVTAGVLAAWSKFRTDRSGDKKTDAEVDTIDIKNREMLLNAITAERKQDAMERKKEQQWLNEQYRETANRWQQQYQKLSEEMQKLMQDHIKCREDNAVMKAQIEDLQDRINALEKTYLGGGSL